jgi:hypothetical protein
VDFRNETSKLTSLGQGPREQAISTLSLGVGQLAILLENVSNLDGLVRRMPLRVFTGNRNALVDFYRFKESGMFGMTTVANANAGDPPSG